MFSVRIFLYWWSSLTDGGGSTGNGRPCATIEIVLRYSAHKWKLKMRVRINATGYDQTIGSVNDTHTARHHKIRTRTDIANYTVFDVNVGRKCFVMIHHLATFDVQTILSALPIIWVE